MKRLLFTSLLILIIAAIAFIYVHQRNYRRSLALVSGKTQGWQSITFTGQGRQVTLQDVHSVTYLRDQFKQAKEGVTGTNGTLGLLYDATVELGDGSSCQVRMFIDGNPRVVASTIDSEIIDDPLYFSVQFADPVPAGLRTTLAALSK